MQPELVMMFEAEQVQSLNVNNLGMFFLRAQTHTKIDDAESMLKWMKKHGYKDVIKETVHPSTLKSIVKEQLEPINRFLTECCRSVKQL